MKYVVNKKELESENGKAAAAAEAAPLFPSCRLTLALMTFLSLTVLGLLRSNLTVSLVCMVRKKQPSSSSSSSSLLLSNWTTMSSSVIDVVVDDDVNYFSSTETTDQVGDWLLTTSSSQPSDMNKAEFSWSRQYQGFVLSAYFYGYLATQLLGGFLTGRFGAKYCLLGSVLVAAAATLVTPIAARFSVYLLIVLRVIVGCGTGFIYPAAQSLWGIWAPPLERSILSSFTFIGLNVGYMLTFLISSECCQIQYDNGWPFSFYITGGATLLFCVLWNFLVFSSPDQHPRISDKELNYIKTTTGLKSLTLKERKPFPWLKAASSPSVIALLVVQTSHTWFSYTQSTTVPLYLRDVLRFDIKQNGLFMILPYLLVLLTSPPVAYVADILRARKILSTANVRKLFQAISSFGSVILILIIGFLDYDVRYVAVSLLILMSVVNNVGRYGFLINPQDIAPRYSGEIFGIVNTAASLSGILAPIAVGQLTSNGTLSEWRSIFYISAAAFFVGGLVFVIFAKGEPLPWAKDDIDVQMTVVVVAGTTTTNNTNTINTNTTNTNTNTSSGHGNDNSTAAAAISAVAMSTAEEDGNDSASGLSASVSQTTLQKIRRQEQMRDDNDQQQQMADEEQKNEESTERF